MAGFFLYFVVLRIWLIVAFGLTQILTKEQLLMMVGAPFLRAPEAHPLSKVRYRFNMLRVDLGACVPLVLATARVTPMGLPSRQQQTRFC